MLAKAVLGQVAHGHDPAGEKTTERGMPTIAELAERFLSEHVETKRKPGTAAFYRHILTKIVTPELGTSKADKVTRTQIAKLHAKLHKTPFQANRVLAVMGSMYAFAARTGAVPEGTNPIRKIDKFKEHRRERNLPFAKNADPFSAVIRCTCDENFDSKTISKWARALRYVAHCMVPRARLKTFMKEASGVNACATRYAKLEQGRNRRN